MASCLTAAVCLRGSVTLRVASTRRPTAANRPCAASSSAASGHHVRGESSSVGTLLRQGRSNALGGVAPIARGAAVAATAPSPRRKSVVTRAAKEGDESTANISKKVARTANACKTLGRWGFWSQLVLTTISAVILVFSFLFKGYTKVRLTRRAPSLTLLRRCTAVRKSASRTTHPPPPLSSRPASPRGVGPGRSPSRAK